MEYIVPFGDIVLCNFYTTFRPSFEAWPEQCVRFTQAFEPYWVPDREFAIWTYAQPVPTISISRWLDAQIYGHVGKRTKIIHPGIDPRVFYPDFSRNKNDEKVILYVARDPAAGYTMKGYNDFVNSMNIVRNQYNGTFTVWMVCPERILPLPEIPHQVFSYRNQMQMAELYRSADLFVSTSWFEAFGLPPLEAMACGTPVVATNSGGLLSYAAHLKNAYIATPKDPQSIADGILEVMTNDSLSQKFIHNGLESSRPFTEENFLQKFVDALEEIHRNRNQN